MGRAAKKAVHSNTQRFRKGHRKVGGSKKGRMVTPQPVIDEMKRLWMEGKDISEIARQTKTCWVTVAKVVKSADMRRYLRELREKALDVIPDALEMIHKEMKKAPNKDRVRAGIDLLSKARIFEEEKMLVPMGEVIDVKALQTVDEKDESVARELVIGFAEMAMETHRLFGLDMPEMDAVKAKIKKEKTEVRIAV